MSGAETDQRPSPRSSARSSFASPARSRRPGRRRLAGRARTSQALSWSGPRSRRKSSSTAPPGGLRAFRRAGRTFVSFNTRASPESSKLAAQEEIQDEGANDGEQDHEPDRKVHREAAAPEDEVAGKPL